MKKSHRFENVPSPRLMKTIGATALDAPESVAELVANSLDARIDDRPVRVEVHVDTSSILVVDDASGLDLPTLEAASRLGVDMDQVVRRQRRRMGTYGLGMKTAAASLGDRWGIVTRPINEPGKEYRVSFDLKGFVSRGAVSKDWSIEVIEDVPDVTGPLGNAPQGTAVWVDSLRNRSLMPGPFIDHLGRAFGPFASQYGDTITVNGTVATDDVARYVEGSRYELDVLVNGNEGWRATGWVALDSKTHNRGDFGLHLYRNGQLVETWNKSFFKAHLMTSRILGIVHLDFVPVNFNKKGFETSSEEWRFTVRSLTEALKPAVEASRTMSRGRGDTTRQYRAISKMRQVLGIGTDGGTARRPDSREATDAGHAEVGTQSTGDEMSRHRETITATRDQLELPRGSIRLACDVQSLQDETLPWDYIYADDASELLVLLNPESTVFGATKDVEFLACLAIADCIAHFLVVREGLDFAQARRVRDTWLHGAFAEGYAPTQPGAAASRHAGAPS